MKRVKTALPASPLQPPLLELRDKLLDLHKAVIEFERERYEKTVGTIQSPYHFLQLVTRDPWFAWLHPLSLLIVAIDEAVEQKEPLTETIADALRTQTRALLVADENAQGFSGHYYVALQQEPQVVMTHAAVIKLIGRQKESESK
ncbi:MAG TPA: hypothetical protein VJ063_16835 [Verrucomicrobiae bacterium]|nr:hypothetical protein [Verrucomicrobiae bacterium]